VFSPSLVAVGALAPNATKDMAMLETGCLAASLAGEKQKSD